MSVAKDLLNKYDSIDEFVRSSNESIISSLSDSKFDMEGGHHSCIIIIPLYSEASDSATEMEVKVLFDIDSDPEEPYSFYMQNVILNGTFTFGGSTFRPPKVPAGVLSYIDFEDLNYANGIPSRKKLDRQVRNLNDFEDLVHDMLTLIAEESD